MFNPICIDNLKLVFTRTFRFVQPHILSALASLLIVGAGGATMLSATVPAAANGNTYFVSPSGKNSNPGTLPNPWKTMQFAVYHLQPRDTLYVRGGIYRETVWSGNSGTAASPITIAAYSGESPIIDGAGLTMQNWGFLLGVAGDYTNVSGFELRNANLNGAVANADGLVLGGTGDTASNMLVHDIWSAGIKLQNNNEVLQDSTAYRVSLSNCRLPTATACGLTSGTTYDTQSTWPGCVFAANYRGSVIQNSTIQRVTVYDCWGEGLMTNNSSGTIIQDSISFNNFSQNLYVANAVKTTVQRNIVYNASEPSGYLGNYVPTASFSLADEPIAPQNSSNNTVINNLIYNSPVSLFSWTQVSGTGLQRVLFANNTLVYSPFSTGYGPTAWNPYRIVNRGSVIANNIVYDGQVTVPNVSGITFSHNLWSATPPANASRSGDVIGNPQISATGYTGAGQLTSYYFTLLPTSPAIGKGISLPQVTTNFFLTPTKPPLDIGAY